MAGGDEGEVGELEGDGFELDGSLDNGVVGDLGGGGYQ